MLIMLIVFAWPTFVAVLSDTINFVDEAVPCGQLRSSDNRSRHQSLIGRLSQDPISFTVRASPIQEGVLVVRVTVVNNSIATIPVVYNTIDLILTDNQSDGFGLIFEPPAIGNTIRQTPPQASIPEVDIRLLGPRQRCVIRFDIPVNNLDPSIGNGNGTVRAYYRIGTQGALPPDQTGSAIYSDQGLQILPNGFVESERQSITVAPAQAQ